MEKCSKYIVQITPEAEQYYFDILGYFYQHHSVTSADRKSEELLDLGIKLKHNPFIGRVEENLRFLNKGHRYVLFFYTRRKAIKIIYFVDEANCIIYITDFFPCESDDKKLSFRIG